MTGALLIGGLFSLAVAAVSGLIAYLTARSNSRAGIAASRVNLDGEIRKISSQIEAQEAARERTEIAVLRQRYLTPLRYYAVAMSRRLAELEAKYGSAEDGQVRGWFKIVKDQVARDHRRPDFVTWCYYEGLFSVTTLYYTCSYFEAANEIRFGRPFAVTRPAYSEQLTSHLAAVSDAFVWADGRAGIWGPSQEVLGELFRRDGTKLTYAQMCTELDADDPARRAPYLRPLDFFWSDLHPATTTPLRQALTTLTTFLDTQDPHDPPRPSPLMR